VNALDGLRILDLTRLLPGPFCTMLLGDLGADVIKVEEPRGGDPARHYPPLVGDTGALFLLVNRNKRSVTLDLKAPAGRDLLLRLVDGADVLVESFRPGVMDRLGLGYPALAERNPRLIYATLSGFGQQGPYRDRPGHDLNYLALAGVLGYNVDRQGQPVPPAVQVADLGGGTFGALAIVAAVLARQQTGAGQFVDTSLFGSAVAWLPTLIASLFASGTPPAPSEPRLAGGLAQYDVYRTADGRFISLGALEPKFWQAFLEQIERPELATRPTDEVRAAVRDVFAQRTYAEWIEVLGPVETCWAPVQTLDEALADPQLQALGLLQSIEHPRLGPLAQLGPPFTLSATPAQLRRPPPELGQDTAALLAELGLSDDDVQHLRATGVI